MLLSNRDTSLLIPGPSGSLEAIVSRPEVAAINAIGVVCHPHPLQGGTMHNKVVTTLSRVLNDLGICSVRFNFRGVEKSAGHYAEGIGETDDALAVLNWVKQAFPQQIIWLAGFSFGAYVSLRVASQAPVAQLITVAPPVRYFSAKESFAIDCPWLLVQGEQDEVVSAEEVLAWAEQQAKPPHIIRMTTGHFFHGKLIELRENLVSALRPV
jgi:alpha/beta superfamily hydrolase